MTELERLMKLRYDLTAAQSHVTELIRAERAREKVPRFEHDPPCVQCFCAGGMHTVDCLSEEAVTIRAGFIQEGMEWDAEFARAQVERAKQLLNERAA